MLFSFDTFQEYFPQLLRGAGYTIALSLGSMFFGLLLGFLVAMMRLSKRQIMRMLASVYVSFFRGTPLLVQLFIIYYGLPIIGLKINEATAGTLFATQLDLDLPAFLSAIIGFSLNMGAYLSETIRSAIAAIDKGQWEASESIGMTRFQAMTRVIIPQAARTALPPIGNSFISLVKDTSLAATIQVEELFREAQKAVSSTLHIITFYIGVAIMYWIMATVLSFVQRKLEQHVNKHEEQQ